MQRSRTPILRELQHWLSGRITRASALDASGSEAAVFAALVGAPNRQTAIQRLRIHADGYGARIEEALAETFPAVRHLAGNEAFHAVARRYVERHPPRGYNLNHAGRAFATHLASDPVANELPFLADLARLEWRVTVAFDAPQSAPLRAETLPEWSLADWRRAVLRFQRGVSVVFSEWPLRDLWSLRDAPLETIDVDLRNRPDRVLVRRDGFAVACESLVPGEALALDGLVAGHRLDRVTDRLAQAGEDPARVGAWFSRWMELGLVRGVALR